MKYSKLMLVAVFLRVLAFDSCFAGEYTDQVKAQIRLIRIAAESEGWRETHEPKYDSLRVGEYSTYNVTLRANMKYKLLGFCDNDCNDLDIFLYDENGNEISRDTSTDSMPVADVAPKWTGQFKVKVKMYACRRNPCFLGVSIIGK